MSIEKNYYSIKELRQIISEKDEGGEKIPFSITAFSADEKRQTGGEKIEIEFATLFSQQHEIINLMIMCRDELTKKIVPTGNIRAVHISLITRINNTEIQWT